MGGSGSLVDKKAHKKLAVDLFNHVWALLEKEGRTPWEDDEMVHAAHASRFHWSRAGDAKNLAIGEWQISHVYAILGRGEPARHHAQRNLDLCEEHGIGDFVRAYAYEALARAAAVANDSEGTQAFLEKARATGTQIEDEATRKRFEEDLKSII